MVLIANPNAFHAEVTLAAIAAGKHVFDLKSWVLDKTVPSEETVLEDFALHFDLLHPIQ